MRERTLCLPPGRTRRESHADTLVRSEALGNHELPQDTLESRAVMPHPALVLTIRRVGGVNLVTLEDPPGRSEGRILVDDEFMHHLAKSIKSLAQTRAARSPIA